MSTRFTDRILKYLEHPEYQPVKSRRLAVAMGVAEEEYGDFHDAVDALRRMGRVVFGTGNAVMLPHPPGQVVGTFRANPKGFGFVVPDESTEHGDLYIPPGQSSDAVTGDKVLCMVMRRGKRDGKQAFGGQIIKIIERGNSRFVGQLCKNENVWFVAPDGNMLHVPILIGDPKAKSAREGDQVVVEIVHYPSEGKPAQGVIVERLGERGKPGVDLLSILRQFNISDEFPPEVLEEARTAVRRLDDEALSEGREDLTDKLIITIDPETARDFDDAISLVRLPGNAEAISEGAPRGKKTRRHSGQDGSPAWELGVHIADVSTFVPRGSAIDTEAETRGTSVYFPGHVAPMLPEVLSNGVCSLQENEPRFCKSAFIQYDGTGNVVGARFANTLIRSAKRLTYEQATAILEGHTEDMPKNVVSLLKDMDRLARIIRERRLAEGMIVLDLPSVELILDDDGRVVDARPEDTSFSHTIIEMFMVEANEAVARLFRDARVPFLRRIHEDPDEESLEAMARFVSAVGLKMPKSVSPADLQRLLADLRGKPQGYAINLAVLKSMQMAEYSPKPEGHFALASKAYAHFTSPIRRYPDLMIHRLLQLHIEGKLSRGKRGKQEVEGVLDQDQLVEYGRRMSYLSRRAESAERELKTMKVLELLTKHVGETFEGIVTGVTNFGMFVQHPKFLIEGLLRLEDLGDDWWAVDVEAGRVYGERSRRTFRMGDRVEVTIAAVDGAARQLKLALSGVQARERRGSDSERPRETHRFNKGKRSQRPGRRERQSAGPSASRGPSKGPPRKGHRKGRGGRRR